MKQKPGTFLKHPEIFLELSRIFPEISLFGRLWSGTRTTGHGKFPRIFARVDSDGTLPAAARFVTVGIQGFLMLLKLLYFCRFQSL